MERQACDKAIAAMQLTFGSIDLCIQRDCTDDEGGHIGTNDDDWNAKHLEVQAPAVSTLQGGLELHSSTQNLFHWCCE